MPSVRRRIAATAPPAVVGAVSAPGEAPAPAEWRSRGYMPHRDQAGFIQAITFRLHDSIPAHLLAAWRAERAAAVASADRRSEAELRARLDRWEDAGHGACWLRDPGVARLVENALLHFDGEHYRLLAWCIMPNHVHVLAETGETRRLDQVVHAWKSFTASAANRVLGRRGAFWFREYHDRFIRDERHFENAVHYIEGNPVKAGLVESAEEWPFSSAARRLGVRAPLGAPASLPAALAKERGALRDA